MTGPTRRRFAQSTACGVAGSPLGRRSSAPPADGLRPPQGTSTDYRWSVSHGCHPERSEGPFPRPQRSLAALGMTAKPVSGSRDSGHQTAPSCPAAAAANTTSPGTAICGTVGSPASIRAIGRAALAADNRLNANGVERLAWLLTDASRSDRPVAKMSTTANDCYTGERLVIGQAVARRNGIPLAHAAAATSSLSAAMGPTLLGQRYCMDGGIARTWAHTDLVAGSKRALVIILINGYEGSLLMSGIPHNIHDDVSARSHRHQGRAHHCRNAARGEPSRPEADQAGPRRRLRAREVEVPKIQAFWVRASSLPPCALMP